jgi:thymidylate synthase (FAD)
MQVIQQYCEWVVPPPLNTLQVLELCGRVSYKSEERITDGSAERFLKVILTRKHESVLEHVGATMRFVTDRGVSHELVRHRIASFTQESTRYVNYEKRGMTVIVPIGIDYGSMQYTYWFNHMHDSEWRYNALIDSGVSPQLARSVLPNSLKTEVVMTANLREWRHVFSLRTKPDAHPQMVDLMRQALVMFKEAVPILFDEF